MRLATTAALVAFTFLPVGDDPVARAAPGDASAVSVDVVPGGYVVQDAVGGQFTFGAAPFLGSLPQRGVPASAADLVLTSGGTGSHALDRAGGVHAFGTASFFGSLPGRNVAAEAAALAAVPGGYLVLDHAGGVHAFGAASFLGSLPGRNVAADAVDLAVVDAGAGYYVLDRPGGVHAFGSAVYFGSVVELRRGVTPPSLSVTTVVSGLSIPWDVGFAPDGTMVFTEKAGRLSALVDGARVVLAAPGDVFAGSESGMMGMAIDPGFAQNRLVHVCQAFSSGDTTDVRVYRWQVAGDWSSASRLGGPTVSGIPVTSGRHAGCQLEFGADGFLWVSTGDAATGTHPQDLRSLGGKVLRVMPDTGAAAPGNPFGTAVYTYGHRNPQGLALRPGTSQMYSSEHGPDRDDEINRLRVGGNYGWDPVPGYNEAVAMTDHRKFPDAVGAVWSSGVPPIALSGITFLSGGQWRAWNGALVGAALRGSHLHVWTLDPTGVAVMGESRAVADRGRLRAVAQGPDGSLYVTTSNGGGEDVILRVTPS